MSLELTKVAKKKKKQRKKDPKYVHDKYKEILKGQKGEKNEGLAKGVSWSIYCKYKNPSSPRCKKDPDEYFSNRKAYSSPQEREDSRANAKLVGRTLEHMVGEGLIESYDLIENQASSEYINDLCLYMWTRGKFPSSLMSIGQEAKILGEISHIVHKESKPKRMPNSKEKKEAYNILYKLFSYIYQKWSAKVQSRVSMLLDRKNIDLTIMRMELLSYDNKIRFSYEYDKLLSILFFL